MSGSSSDTTTGRSEVRTRGWAADWAFSWGEGFCGDESASTRHTTASIDAGSLTSGVRSVTPVTPRPVPPRPVVPPSSSPFLTTSTRTPESPTASLSTTREGDALSTSRVFFAAKEPMSSSNARDVSRVDLGTTIVGASSATSSRTALTPPPPLPGFEPPTSPSAALAGADSFPPSSASPMPSTSPVTKARHSVTSLLRKTTRVGRSLALTLELAPSASVPTSKVS